MSRKLVVNPITCVGHGICAELLPERITLDPWGYPIIDPTPIPPPPRGPRPAGGGRLPDPGPAVARSVEAAAEIDR